MGQQQLLLIVLGVIVVGIAIVVGINLFNQNSISSNRDAVISDLNNYAAQAMSYYKKPGSMGGGSNSFLNFKYGNGSDSISTANGVYKAGAGTATGITINGKGTSFDETGTALIEYNATVDNKGGISIAKVK